MFYRWAKSKDQSGPNQNSEISASVFVVQVVPVDAAGPDQLSFGEYILKFDGINKWNPAEPREWQRHETARARNVVFAEDHIPSLIRHEELDDRVVMLYDIAGSSLSSFVTASFVENQAALLKQLRRISMVWLDSFNVRREEKAGVTARVMLDALLGYRLDPTKAEGLHRFVRSEYGDSGSAIIAGRVMANALSFCTSKSILEEPSRVEYSGFLHGDFHQGNILLDKARPSSSDFWIIDFALSFLGPIGYDHSYLEVGSLLGHFEGIGPEREVNTLTALDLDVTDPSANSVHPSDVGLKQCIGAIREELYSWQRRVYPKSYDSVQAQILLTRVAAGLNWANKPLETKQRKLAFTYASCAATNYLQRFHPSEWKEIQEDAARSVRVGSSQPPGAAILQDWHQIREAAQRFDRSLAEYVLVVGSLQGIPDSASLGLLPWAAIIDLDPESDRKGFHAAASPLLGKLRALQIFGRDWTSVNLAKGTAWMMAGGWTAHDETFDDDRSWGRMYPALIRQLCEQLRATRPAVPVYVLILSDTFKSNYLQRILQEIDSALGDSAKTLLLSHEAAQEELVHKWFRADPPGFCAAVRGEYGIDVDEESVFVPGRNGPVAINPEQLRRIEEDIELLHNRVLDNTHGQNQQKDEFWKGSPPTWVDLHSHLDIRREIQDELQRLIDTALTNGDRATITLHHTPGAGGTTVALRAAWENRDKIPVAVLRRYSKYTSDRIDDIFHLTQATVLLVADASILPESDREDLYHMLALRHATAIILYTVRTTDTRRGYPLTLFDPMAPAEALAFEKVYASQTVDLRRKNELHEIATSDKSRTLAYRSPFFFGLVTYQEQYRRVYDYVHNCLQGAGFMVQNLLRILALVTRYSQIGLDEQICPALLNAVSGTEPDFEKLLGTGPARLVVRQDTSVRLAHPVVALEVLHELMGGRDGDWRVGLKDLCVHFVREMKRVLPTAGEQTKTLMEDLFIRRDDSASEISTRNFAPLIIEAGRPPAGSHAGQQEIFAELTSAFPDNGHYWNHRARHLIYLIKRDYQDAIRFLDKAIELGRKEGDAMVHYQTKGLAYRFWVNDRCTQAFMSSPPPSPTDLFVQIRQLVEDAFECFRIAHEKKPNSRYPFVTRIQVTIEVAEALIRASGGGTIHELIESGGIVGLWLQGNYVIAVEDLETLKVMRADSEPSKYEITCESDLKKLYGDFDDMVRIWETILPTAADPVLARRSLAVAYFTRGDREWDNVGESDLKRTVDMMEQNLVDDPGNQRDIRMWFQAARRLPGFSYYSALNRLTSWAKKYESAEAHYYLYIINFLMWRNSRSSMGEEQILVHIKRCKELTELRTDYSYEWLALEPAWCPIIGHRALGKIQPRTAKSLFEDTTRLARVSGFTLPFFERQGGEVRVGPRLKAFFVPTEEMHAYKDQQREINFFVGFSYEGLRAWNPKLGSLPATSIPDRQVDPSKPRTQIAPKTSGMTAAPKLNPIDFRKRVQETITEIVFKAERSGHPISLAELGDALTRAFPEIYGKIAREAGYANLTQMVQGNRSVRIEGVAPKEIVRRDSAEH